MRVTLNFKLPLRQPVLFVMLSLVICLVSAQSLSLAHEPTHHSHDQSELCEALSVYGSGKDFVETQEALQYSCFRSESVAQWANAPYTDVVLFDLRSRSPPLFYSFAYNV